MSLVTYCPLFCQHSCLPRGKVTARETILGCRIRSHTDGSQWLLRKGNYDDILNDVDSVRQKDG